jgi:hypothetical protein
MHCPWCGHTCPEHHAENGCTECRCSMSWVSVLAVNLRLQMA